MDAKIIVEKFVLLILWTFCFLTTTGLEITVSRNYEVAKLSAPVVSNLQRRISTKQRIVEGPENRSVVLGEIARLRCKVKDQAGMVYWTKRGFVLGTDRELVSHPRYSMVGSSTEGEYDLQIKDVRMSDEDTYQCHILAGEVEQPKQSSAIVTVTVLVPPSPPSFLDLDPEKTVKGRESFPLTARCLSQGGKPEASVEWFIADDPDGKKLSRTLVQESPNEISIHNQLNDVESTIQFAPESSDTDKYLVCAAKHPAVDTVMMTSAMLKIRSKPKIRIKLNSSRESLVENGFVVLSCDDDDDLATTIANDNTTIAEQQRQQPKEIPPPLKYQWLANGQLVESANQKVLRLVKLNRTLHHGVEYTCRAENDVGQSESTYKMDVRYAPHFKSDIQKFILSEGDMALFICFVDSNPLPSSYKWTKSGGTSRLAPSFGQNLTIENVQRAHEGSYSCEVTVDGFQSVRQTHQLYVRGPPKVIIENAPDAVDGGSAKISCKITGYPKAYDNVTWYRGRTVVSSQMGHRFEISTSRVNDEELYSVLVIRKVLTMDFDLYNCTARNLIDIGWASTRLVESNFPVHVMVPGVIGGCLAILLIAMAIVWANRKFICRSKSSMASDVQMTCDDLSPKYNADTYSTSGPMTDSMEGMGTKANYIRIPQENPDLEEPYYPHQQLMPFLPNGSARHYSPYAHLTSVTPPPHLNDLGANGGYILSDMAPNGNLHQQPHVHQTTFVPRIAAGPQNIYAAHVPHFSIQPAKNYAQLNLNNGNCSTFGRYPSSMANGHSLDNLANGGGPLQSQQQHLYRYSPQLLPPKSNNMNLNNQLYLAPNYPMQIHSNSGGNLTLVALETVPEVATPDMMDDNAASLYDNSNMGLNNGYLANSMEVVLGEDGRTMHRCPSQLSTHV